MSALNQAAQAVGRVVKRAVLSPRTIAIAAARSPRRALVTFGCLFLVSLVAFGAFFYAAALHDQRDQAERDARSTAEKSVAALLSYQHGTVEQDAGRRAGMLTGKFRDEYANLLRTVIVPESQTRQVTTSTSVAHSSVIRNDGPDRVWVLMFLNQSTTAAGQPEPVFNGSRVRVGMERLPDRWAVSEITPL